MDDILTSHNNQERLNEIINGLDEILTAGGLALKPWVRSGQSGRSEVGAPTQGPEESISQAKTIVLPNQLRDEENSEVRLKTPNPLSRRHLLSQVSGLYDPIGLVTPAKQKGAIIVRKAF